MKKSLKNIIRMSVLSGLCAFGVLSGSLAWFNLRAKINDRNLLLGSSIGAYFGGGDGSAETPYIINTSTHLYNLAWLQYLGFFNEDKTHLENGEPVAGGDGEIDKQYYFILQNDIEMNGMYIPPIGTETHPFLGNFNGNNHVISDFTSSNILGENHISKKPTIVTSLTGTDIIGFFGVVGELPSTDLTYNSAINAIYNFGLDDFVVESSNSTNGNLVGLAAGYLNGDISGVGVGESGFNLASGITAIANSRIDSAKTTTNISDYALIGYATEEHVKKTNIVNLSANEPKVRQGKATSEVGSFEGASIPMSAIYTRLHDLRDDAVRKSVVSQIDRYFDENNQIIDSRTQEYTTTPIVGSYSSGDFFYEDIDSQDPNGNTFASYSFARRVNSGTSTYSDDKFIYISGSDEVDYTRTYNDYKTVTYPGAIYIHKTVGTTTHYLTINNNRNGITDSTSESTKWFYENSRIYTIYNGTNYYLTRNNNNLTVSTTQSDNNLWNNSNNVFTNGSGTTYYYLRYNNGWNVTTLPTTAYTTGYHISDGNGNYLSATNTPTITNQRSAENATVWTINNNNVTLTINNTTYYVRSSTNSGNSLTITNSAQYAFTRNNNTLRYRRNNNSSYYYVYYTGSAWSSNTTNSRNLQFDFVFNITSQDATYKVDTGNAGSLNDFSPTPDVSTEQLTYSTYDTYFPLKYTEGDTDVGLGNTGYIIGGSRFFDSSQMISDMRVSSYTTNNLKGTFVNGSTAQTTYSNNTRQYFKVLTKTYKTYNVSTYNSNTNNYFAVVADDFNNGTHGNNVALRVFNSTTATTSTSRNYKYARYDQIGLTKYGDARSDLDETWKKDGGNIYGLHFMNALIDKNEKIAIDKAIINNQTYIKESDGLYHHYETVDKLDEHGNVMIDDERNPIKETNEVGLMSGGYEMPKDCIDFNLGENATINFFAGTYFSGNDAFFSLHRIFRKTSKTTTTIDGETVEISDGNQIEDIKEIHYVYQNTEYSVANREVPRYIYLYTDGSYGYGEEIIASNDFDQSKLGTMLFNTEWIKGQGTANSLIYNASYYFEIPAVKGEYALGSVNGKTGAYLMYLDIGAAEINDDIIDVNETITISEDIFLHPEGVDFCVVPLGENQTFAAIITSEKVGTVVVPTGVYGDDISFSLVETTNQQTEVVTRVLTCGPPDSATKLTKSTYLADQATITCNGVNLTADRSGWKQEVRNISTKYTYSKEELALVTTVVYSSVVTSNTDPEGTATGYTVTNDPIPYEEAAYNAVKLEVNEATGETGYVTMRYYVVGEDDPEVTCEYTTVRDTNSFMYVYEFTITTTADIVLYIDSLVSSITQTSNVEVYSLKINGTTYYAGDIVPISAT